MNNKENPRLQEIAYFHSDLSGINVVNKFCGVCRGFGYFEVFQNLFDANAFAKISLFLCDHGLRNSKAAVV